MQKEIKVEIEPALFKVLNKIQNREPLLRNISGIMLDDVHENFEQEGRPAWRALSEKTIKDRQSKGYWPGKILQRTGQLLKSIISKYDNNSAQVGTNKNYAALHQFGGTINQAARQNLFIHSRYTKGNKKGKFKKGTEFGQGSAIKAHTIKVPPRPFLVLSDSALKEIEDEVKKIIKF